RSVRPTAGTFQAGGSKKTYRRVLHANQVSSSKGLLRQGEQAYLISQERRFPALQPQLRALLARIEQREVSELLGGVFSDLNRLLGYLDGVSAAARLGESA